MKLNVSKANLISALQKVNGIISVRSTLHILNNALIEASDSNLSIITTDLEIRIKTEIASEIEEAGKITIPARRFYDIVKELYDDSIELESVNNHLSIKSGYSNFKLLGLPADDFPVPIKGVPITSFVVEQSELSRMINLVSYAVSVDDTRKALNGVLFSINDGNFTLVATDGKRLALIERNIDKFSGENIDLIVPIKSALEVNKILHKDGSVKIEIAKNIVNFILDNGTILTSKLIDEVYPNYKQVIPISFSRIVKLPRKKFADAIKRTSLVVSKNSFCINFKFKNSRVEISALSSDIGEAKDMIEVDYNGPEIDISFNPMFLLDALARLDSDIIEMKMNEGYSPAAISNDDGFLYVIMPMKRRQ